MSDDDHWSDVIDQVLNALNQANVSDPNTRDALADGVREALESMGMGMGINIEISSSGDVNVDGASPDVEVVDGGRNPDQPPTEGKKPALRIATPNEENGAETKADDETNDTAPYVTQVKVLQGNPFGPAANMSFMPNHPLLEFC